MKWVCSLIQLSKAWLWGKEVIVELSDCACVCVDIYESGEEGEGGGMWPF